MENSLKQRLVGAIVLIALAVIFLPSILKEKNNQTPFVTQIPPKPTNLVEYRIKDGVKKQNESVQNKLDSIEKSHQAILDSRIDKEPINNGVIGNGAKEITAQTDKKDALSQALSDSQNKAKVAQSKAQETAVEKQKEQKLAETKEFALTDLDTNQIDKRKTKTFKDAAWVLQVASFSNKSNAISYVESLRKANFTAYRRDKSTSTSRQIYRIYVGPFIKKDDAIKAQSRLESEMKAKAILKQFDPNSH